MNSYEPSDYVDEMVDPEPETAIPRSFEDAVELGLRAFACIHEETKLKLRKEAAYFKILLDYRAPKRTITKEEIALANERIDLAWNSIVVYIASDLQSRLLFGEDTAEETLLPSYVQLLKDHLKLDTTDLEEHMLAAYVAVLDPIFDKQLVSHIRSSIVRIWARSLAPQSRIAKRFFIVMMLIRTSIGIKVARQRVSALRFTCQFAIPLTVQPCAP